MKKWSYYNDNDPYILEWVRNLIKAGLISDGEVDGRSITEVKSEDIKGFIQCHFFCGIGGWSYALRLAGWPDDRPVWTASCPCPPFSVAGKQAKCPACKSACLVWCPGRTGFAICADCEHAWLADARHLWPEVWRLTAESRPGRIFGEQVDSVGALAWLSAVSASLEILGYAVGAEGLPASSVGAPHIRQRLWWVADAKRNQRKTRRPPDQFRECSAPEGVRAHAESGRRSAVGGLDDTPSARCEPKGRGKPEEPQGRGCLLGVGCEDGGVADSDGSHTEFIARNRPGPDGTEGRRPSGGVTGRRQVSGGLGNTDESGSQGRHDRSDANAGQQYPWAAGEFIACDDDKARPVEPGIFPLADGLPEALDGGGTIPRIGVIRGAGNAIVPECAAGFIRAWADVRGAK